MWKYVMIFFMRSKTLLKKAIIKAVKSSIPKLGNGRIKAVFRTFVQLSLCMHHDIIFNYMIRYCIFHSTLSHSVQGTRIQLNKWISIQYFLYLQCSLCALMFYIIPGLYIILSSLDIMLYRRGTNDNFFHMLNLNFGIS